MSYCSKCGKQIVEGAAFCIGCGAPVVQETQDSAPAVSQIIGEREKREEQEFLDTTHRLLRWERKAWSIASKAFIIMGAVFAGLFFLIFFIGIIAAVDGDSNGGGIAMGVGILYAIIYGSMFIGIGVVSKKACDKIPQYLDTLYTDFSLTYNRCGSVGMLVFTAIFGVVSPVFFIINFVRMKTNRSVIQRIMNNQRVY